MIVETKFEFDSFLENFEENTQCDLEGNCVTKHIKTDKGIIERVNKKIVSEDGRMLLK